MTDTETPTDIFYGETPEPEAETSKRTPIPKVYDTIIIGGGPAGLTAAIYASRGGLSTLLLEGIMESSTVMPGGQLNLTPEIENYPGFLEGTGTDLVQVMRQQAVNFGTEVKSLKVDGFSLEGDIKEVSASEYPGYMPSETFHARTVVLATGAVARRLNIPGEDEWFGRGVSTCATCDGAFFQGESVAIIGGGDTAVEEALYLSKIAKDVTLIHRRDTLRASGKDVEKLLATPNVKVLWNTVVENISPGTADFFPGVDIRDVEHGDVGFLDIKGLFIAIGHDPATELLANDDHVYIIETDDSGFIVAQEGTTKTAIPGLFVAGDVADSKYRQAVTAAASGCQAAMDLTEYINNQ